MCNTTKNDSLYIIGCFPLGVGVEVVMIGLAALLVLIIMVIGDAHRRIKASVRDLPEIVALQGNSNI